MVFRLVLLDQNPSNWPLAAGVPVGPVPVTAAIGFVGIICQRQNHQSHQRCVTTNVSYTAWDEPDNGSFPRSDSQWWEAMRRAALIVRARMPQAQFMGPDLAVYSIERVSGYLQHLKNNGNAVPDSVGWHEILQPATTCCGSPHQPYVDAGFVSRVQTLRNWMTTNAILAPSGAIPNIEIGEMLPWDGQSMRPAAVIASYANLLRGGVLRASFAVWADPGNPSGGQNFTMGRSRPASHGLAEAIQMVGDQSLCRSGRALYDRDSRGWLRRMASLDTGIARIILGNVGGASSTAILLSNVSALTGNSSVTVTVERIPDSGFTTLANPIPILTNAPMAVTGGSVRTPLLARHSGMGMWSRWRSRRKITHQWPRVAPDAPVIGHQFPRCPTGGGGGRLTPRGITCPQNFVGAARGLTVSARRTRTASSRFSCRWT